MPIYKTEDGKVYNVSEENIDKFVKENPSATDVSALPYDAASEGVDQTYSSVVEPAPVQVSQDVQQEELSSLDKLEVHLNLHILLIQSLQKRLKRKKKEKMKRKSGKKRIKLS